MSLWFISLGKSVMSSCHNIETSEQMQDKTKTIMKMLLIIIYISIKITGLYKTLTNVYSNKRQSSTHCLFLPLSWECLSGG